jgi:hypothetical protein
VNLEKIEQKNGDTLKLLADNKKAVAMRVQNIAPPKLLSLIELMLI